MTTIDCQLARALREMHRQEANLDNEDDDEFRVSRLFSSKDTSLATSSSARPIYDNLSEYLRTPDDEEDDRMSDIE